MDVKRVFEDATTAFRHIDSGDDPAKELEIIVRGHEKGISKEDYEEFVNTYDGAGLISRYISSNLSLLAHANLESDVFYQRLWETIKSDVMLASEADKSIALYFVLVSQLLPYYKLPLTRMDSEEFVERQSSLSTEVGKVRHIVMREFDQATEEASSLLEILEGLDDPQDQTVLLATYILMHQ